MWTKTLLPFALWSGAICPGLVASAQAAVHRPVRIGEAAEVLRELEADIVEAEKAAATVESVSDEELARRLVSGQLMLADGDPERASIVFLDLLENYGKTSSGRQSVFFLGEALAKLKMRRWSAECFSGILADNSAEGTRYKQKALSRLLDLASPRQEKGFARRPGLSATPEFRARLEAIGLSVESKPVDGIFALADKNRLAAWVRSVPDVDREPQLRYAFGRYLFLQGEFVEATEVLIPHWAPEREEKPSAEDSLYWTQTGYILGASFLGLGQTQDAVAQFEALTFGRTLSAEEAEIVNLAWMALGRIYHDDANYIEAVASYRQISRDSPFFAEAMYETVWTLLRGKAYGRALQILDVLLVYDPNSPIAMEIKQLRGKLKIQQRDWKGAEKQFFALRREAAKLSDSLMTHMKREGDAAMYFASVVAGDAQHFSLASVLPAAAVPVANRLPRAIQGEQLGKAIGEIKVELRDTVAMLELMEEAVRSPQRARLFVDLSGQIAIMDAASVDLLGLQEDLLRRRVRSNRRRRLRELDKVRGQFRARFKDPESGSATRDATMMRIEGLMEEIHRYDLMVSNLRAQLVATERYYQQTSKRQKISTKGFLRQAAEIRDNITSLLEYVQALREETRQLRTGLQFSDPWHTKRLALVAKYRSLLTNMYQKASRDGNDADVDALWSKADSLQQRVAKNYGALDVAGGRRLDSAMTILEIERSKLNGYVKEYAALAQSGNLLAGQVLEASYYDVVSEVMNSITRSEVGILDVAWAVQEVEADEIRRLEGNRARDLQELERVLDQVWEELE